MRRCGLKVFSIFDFGDHFLQWSETILAILVEGHPRDIHFPEIILKSGQMSFKVFFYF